MTAGRTRTNLLSLGTDTSISSIELLVVTSPDSAACAAGRLVGAKIRAVYLASNLPGGAADGSFF